MKKLLLCGICIAACSSSDEPDVTEKEAVIADTFDMFPIGWEFTGVTWDGDVGLHRDIGDSPPSGFIAWDNDGWLKMQVPYAAQTLEAGIDTAIEIEAPGTQELTLLVQDEATVPFAWVTLREVLNESDGSPTAGYPAGSTLEAACGFGARTAQAMTAVEARAGLHPLHIIIDERGARCGVDGIDLAIGTQESVTATVTYKIDAARTHGFSGKAHIDNARLLRGTLDAR